MTFTPAAGPNYLDCPTWNTCTPANADLSIPARAIYVEVAGNVHFTNTDDSEDTIPIDANVMFIGKFKRIWSTGTTATGIHIGL